MKENRTEILHDLLEKKSFTELSSNEKQFVLKSMSEFEYSQERAIIMNLAASFSNNNPKPKPLIIPTSKSTRVIPLYQAIAAVASVAAVIIFYFSLDNNEIEVITNTEYIVKHDTIQVEKVIYDTIVHHTQKTVYIEKDVFVEASNAGCQIEEPRLLDASPSIILPDLNLVEVENSGTSLKNDATAVLITDYLNPY